MWPDSVRKFSAAVTGWMAAGLIAVQLVSTVQASPLKDDEYVLFLPTTVYQVGPGKVQMDIQAWIYEKERRPGFTALLASYMDVDRDSLSPVDLERLYRRSQLFRVDSERGKSAVIRLEDGSLHRLPVSGADGRTSLTLSVSDGLVKDGRVSFSLYRPPRGEPVQGAAWFAAPVGVSVVSDIDDTIKHSQVGDRKALLRNTFVYPFQAATGMVPWYQRLSRDLPGAAFHYLSSSPIQLYPELQAFVADVGFPSGSMHLRESTSWRNVVAGSDTSMEHKREALLRLLTQYPQRHFVLVGDSGERDPEIYAEIARSHPQQVTAIAIRDVTGEDAGSPRYRRVFEGISPERWRVFTSPEAMGKWPVGL